MVEKNGITSFNNGWENDKRGKPRIQVLELLAAITKIKEESFERLYAMIDSYERMAAEDLPTPQPPVEFSTKTGTVLRLVPTGKD